MLTQYLTGATHPLGGSLDTRLVDFVGVVGGTAVTVLERLAPHVARLRVPCVPLGPPPFAAVPPVQFSALLHSTSRPLFHSTPELMTMPLDLPLFACVFVSAP